MKMVPVTILVSLRAPFVDVDGVDVRAINIIRFVRAEQIVSA